MSLARISPTPSTASSSASVAASSSSRPPNSATISATTILRQPRDAPEHAVAARRDRVVERVQLAVVAEQLGQAAEVEQVLVGEAPDLLERGGERLVGVVGEVVAHERRLLGGRADHRLLELHLDQAALAAELDDVALDLDRHARHELGALQHGEHVVQRRRRPRTRAPSGAWRPGPGGCGTCRAWPAPGWPWRARRGCPRGCTWRRRRTPRRPRGAGRSRSRARRSAWRRARRCGGGCPSRARGSSGRASAGRSPS